MLIGFGFQAGVGKDTICDYLVKKYSWKKRSFAGNLKRCCSSVFNLPIEFFYDQELKCRKLQSPIPFNLYYFSSIIKWMNESIEDTHISMLPEIYKENMYRVLYTPRDVLQFVGTEIMRTHFPDYHIKTCLNGIGDGCNYAICDVRFRNEGEAIVNAGGICVNVCGDTSLSGSNISHASEVDLVGWDGWRYIIQNNKNDGFDVLYVKVDKLLTELEDAFRK